MRFSVLGIDGHLGDRVSALVDGQLSAAEEEQAWDHTMGCPGCRRLVEREGWLKSRLSSMSVTAPTATTPVMADGLIGSLYDVDAWATVDGIEQESRRRRSLVVAMGAGSVGAAVIGLVVLTGAPVGVDRVPRQAPAQVSTGLPTPVGSPSPTGSRLPHRAR